MDNLPKVTFIIAHYNYEQYLSNAIQSALNQTYPNIHICVIDDHSKNQDEVVKVIEQFIQPSAIVNQDNLVINHSDKITSIYITDRNHGQAYARNRGIEYCWNDTDIFAILDADDENYPTKIEKCIKPFIQNPTEIGAVYSDIAIYNVDTKSLVNEYREPFDSFRLLQECIVHSGCLISKYALSVVLENGLVFDEEMPPCEDYDLWIRLSEKFLLIHIPEILNFVRVHPQNSTNTTTNEHRISRIQRIHQKRSQRLNGI
jgi:glycosyltransferase involved in cell wall biosynthesis